MNAIGSMVEWVLTKYTSDTSNLLGKKEDCYWIVKYVSDMFSRREF